MRIFLFEFVSGGGWWSVDPTGRPSRSLLQEGKAMLSSLASDFSAVTDCEVTLVQDRRVRRPITIPGVTTLLVRHSEDLSRILRENAAQSDYGVVVAPEFSQHLYDAAMKWTLQGGTLLGPSCEFIRIASSKSLTVEHLARARVPVPHGMLLHWPDKLPRDFPLPAILKPDDGAGSLGLLYVRERRDGAAQKRMSAAQWRLEQFCPGLPVSIGILSGPHGAFPLPACLQWLTADRTFRYQGGMTPIKADLNARAQRLAMSVAAAMPPAIGYFGVDAVLGESDDGSEDYVIEVNPRLTTSYVGLRAISRNNLALAMLDIARGRRCDLSFDDRRVQFTPDGQVVALS